MSLIEKLVKKFRRKKLSKKEEKKLKDMFRLELNKKIKPVKVKDIMTTNVKAVKEDDTLKDVVELFARHKISGAPVVKGRKVVGVISESDIVRVIGKDNVFDIHDIELLEKTKVKKVMNKKPIVVNENDSLEYAITLMTKKDVNRLPVVNKKGELVGIVARADVVRGMLEILFVAAMQRGTFGMVMETEIDRILDLVKDKPMRINKIAKKLKKPEEQVEEWVKILEEHGLVKVEYPTIGKPIVRRVE
ncbi:MAG: CBS domain-containing protein [Candidatus Aenigmarchaeota archaeon]|nr:CBS domain-containing protein [Candidatus Aenigmarchaeota archaeon]